MEAITVSRKQHVMHSSYRPT